MSMSTLINGADAGVAIITSAVAAANATLTRAHQVVGQVDDLASNWAQSPIGNIVGGWSLERPCPLTCAHQGVGRSSNWARHLATGHTHSCSPV